MGSRNRLVLNRSTQESSFAKTVPNHRRQVVLAISKLFSSGWLTDFRTFLQLARGLYSSGLYSSGLYSNGTHLSPMPACGPRARVLSIDPLESRELFAVLSGLVYEDVNRDNLFDPKIDLPAAHQLVFVDQNGNGLYDTDEMSGLSNANGVAEFSLNFGNWGTILPVPRLQDALQTSTDNSSGLYVPLSVAAFDTVFRGEDSFDPLARLSGGTSDWLILPSTAEGEDDIAGNNVTVRTSSLNENESLTVEVGEIFLFGQTPPETWVWFVSDERFEVIGNKIFNKADSPIDFEQEPKVVMVVEGFDNSAIGPASSESLKTTITINILDRNDVPTGLFLNGNTVLERLAGATVGAIQVIDQDVGEAFEYFVSDDRFEIVGSILKLREGVAVFFDSEPLIEVTISARSVLDPAHFIESLAEIEVLANPTPWTNGISPFDVNGDGYINATDPLIIINLLNSVGGTVTLPAVATSRPTQSRPDYVDVNGDGVVGAIDALIVINRLRRSGTGSNNNGGSTGSNN